MLGRTSLGQVTKWECGAWTGSKCRVSIKFTAVGDRAPVTATFEGLSAWGVSVRSALPGASGNDFRCLCPTYDMSHVTYVLIQRTRMVKQAGKTRTVDAFGRRGVSCASTPATFLVFPIIYKLNCKKKRPWVKGISFQHLSSRAGV